MQILGAESVMVEAQNATHTTPNAIATRMAKAIRSYAFDQWQPIFAFD